MAFFHVAIIMDGNGRWAAARQRPRVFGHRAGAEAVRRTVEAAPSLGIDILTLYAFSSDNWKRPRAEVETLMRLFRDYLAREAARCADNGIRLRVIGRRDRLPPEVCRAIARAEADTAAASRLDLRIAVDYSSRDAIVRAAQFAGGPLPPTAIPFPRLLATATNSSRRRTSTFSSGRAASSASAISCCGSVPMRNCISLPACGPISTRRHSKPPSKIFTGATGASARFPRLSALESPSPAGEDPYAAAPVVIKY